MGMLRSICDMVLHFSKTLCTINAKRGEAPMENPQTNNQMQLKKVAGNPPRQKISRFRLRMRI